MRQKSQKLKGLRVRSEILHKKRVFISDEISNKMCLVTNVDGNLGKISYFFNTLNIIIIIIKAYY